MRVAVLPFGSDVLVESMRWAQWMLILAYLHPRLRGGLSTLGLALQQFYQHIGCVLTILRSSTQPVSP